ncbi:MAG: hypothetical protein JXA21_16875 [Anaerolineae bacterium]|nr:hypothetical protein [Anaerolineae bacterium]
MMRKLHFSLSLIMLLLLLGAISALAIAQTNGYHIAAWTLDNGGGASAGGRFAVTGTIGQSDASAAMQGGAYSLTGGYWGNAGSYQIFLPLVLRG